MSSRIVWKDALTPTKPRPKVRPRTAGHDRARAAEAQPRSEVKFVQGRIGVKKRRTKRRVPDPNGAGCLSVFSQATMEEKPRSRGKRQRAGGGVLSPPSTEDEEASPREDRQSSPMSREPLGINELSETSGFVWDDDDVGDEHLGLMLSPRAWPANEGSWLGIPSSFTQPLDQSCFQIAYPQHESIQQPGEEEQNGSNSQASCTISAGIAYQNLAHKYQDILTVYDTNYCVLPLSTDCPSNPFRVSMSSIERYPFLMHGVLAIASRHRAKWEQSSLLGDRAHEHWMTSLQHLGGVKYSESNFLALLDTMLVLANFESTTSAYNNISTHVSGAQKMLQEAGALKLSRDSSRLRAKIAMLAWWDVTVSLMARRRPQMPASYLEALAAYDGDEREGWSNFSLNGCPLVFLQAMHRLAGLASIYEQTKHLDHVLFDRTAVGAVTKQVEQYHESNTFASTCSEEGEAMAEHDQRRNHHHCTEAWRHAILLYTQRVFQPEQKPAGLHRINTLSRFILDSVRCCPPTETLQKQMLLPIFLAAAEVGEGWHRDFARAYCRHWSAATGFEQFDTVGGLLEEIWSGWRDDGRSKYWWGVKVTAAGEEGGQEMARLWQLG